MITSRRGIALLVVLWVTAILTVTVFSFSVLTRAEGQGTVAFKEGLEKRLLAEAGIERGILEMVHRAVHRSQTVLIEGREPWSLDGTAYDVALGRGGFTVRLSDETGKISLNGLTDASGIILKNLLVRQGTAPEEADIVVDSILDWKDGDDLHRLHGAETDYYRSLAKPYGARNADFETLEELILVRGVTPEMLYGTDRRRGLVHLLTVHDKSGRINLQTAPREVLEALPGMDAETLERTLDFRRATAGGRPLPGEALGAASAAMAPFVALGAAAGKTCSLESTGYLDDPRKGYAIMATITFDAANRYRYVYYKRPVDRLP